jgi:hypothetical protein
MMGGAGDDDINGGEGDDIALYDGASSQFTVRYSYSVSETSITDRTGREGTDTGGTNTLRFSDRDWTQIPNEGFYFSEVDLSQTDFTSLAELYIAYFNRAPDAEGLYYWTLAFLNGTSLDQAAEFFFDQPETRALYGTELNTPVFVTSVYENVLGRGPDDIGQAFWVDALTDGTVTEGQFIRAFLLGARAEAPLGASDDFAAQQDADRAYLDAKTDIGLYFGAILGMSDIDNANEAMSLFDGSAASLIAAQEAADDAYQAALATDGSGEFIIQLVGLVDSPFEDMIV